MRTNLVAVLNNFCKVVNSFLAVEGIIGSGFQYENIRGKVKESCLKEEELNLRFQNVWFTGIQRTKKEKLKTGGLHSFGGDSSVEGITSHFLELYQYDSP